MISRRTRYSLAQLLDQQPPKGVALLLAKHGLSATPRPEYALDELLMALHGADEAALAGLLSELLRTPEDLRARVQPPERFDERRGDLLRCLSADGYRWADGRFSRADPTLGAEPLIEDDLIDAVRALDTPHAEDVLQMLSDSAHALRTEPPDPAASLQHARVALETLVGDLAGRVAEEFGGSWRKTDWSDVLRYLRARHELTVEQELGLAGTFRLMLPSTHGPSPLPPQQLARLGRACALHVAWFMLQNHQARRASKAAAPGAQAGEQAAAQAAATPSPQTRAASVPTPQPAPRPLSPLPLLTSPASLSPVSETRTSSDAPASA